MAQKINLDLVAAGACPEVSYLAQGRNSFSWGLLTSQTHTEIGVYCPQPQLESFQCSLSHFIQPWSQVTVEACPEVICLALSKD